jgi:AbrB family looped-hinge helix DNA binding protein
MEKIITHIDQYGRVFIPLQARQRFDIKPGDKLDVEILKNELKIMCPPM